jgi:hypothetical protein
MYYVWVSPKTAKCSDYCERYGRVKKQLDTQLLEMFCLSPRGVVTLEDR